MSWQRADQLVRGGKVYTRADPSSRVEALALGGSTVIGAGDSVDLEGLVGPHTDVVDLEGRTVLPGLTDAHIHLEKYARDQDLLNCGTADLDTCLQRIQSRADELPEGTWIEGHGWDQTQWGRWPNTDMLDRVAPAHPVYLTARSLHAAAANTAALRASGISDDVKDPPDGRFQRTPDGRLTGVLFEGAMTLVSQTIPVPSTTQMTHMITAAQERLWRLGLTGIHDFDGRACFSALQTLHAEGRLGLRTVKNLLVKYLKPASQIGLRSGFGDDMLRMGNVKVFADGALGPRTAAMLEPYIDDPDNYGMLLLDQEELLEISLDAVRAGWPMTIHAIGDQANHHVLNAFEALRTVCHQEGLRWSARHRIEHVQLLKPEDVGRLADLQVVASMQPIHATSDRAMAIAGWGEERVENAYGWGSLLESGTALVFGSDAPVESPNPFWGLHAAVNRTAPDAATNSAAWTPHQRIDLQSALKAYTEGPAALAGHSRPSGQLTKGALADLIVLDEDPFELSPGSLGSVKPVGTMVNGTWRYRSF